MEIREEKGKEKKGREEIEKREKRKRERRETEAREEGEKERKRREEEKGGEERRKRKKDMEDLNFVCVRALKVKLKSTTILPSSVPALSQLKVLVALLPRTRDLFLSGYHEREETFPKEAFFLACKPTNRKCGEQNSVVFL